jgi:hypothetical protein
MPEVKNAWSYISTLPYVFIMRCFTEQRGSVRLDAAAPNFLLSCFRVRNRHERLLGTLIKNCYGSWKPLDALAGQIRVTADRLSCSLALLCCRYELNMLQPVGIRYSQHQNDIDLQCLSYVCRSLQYPFVSKRLQVNVPVLWSLITTNQSVLGWTRDYSLRDADFLVSVHFCLWSSKAQTFSCLSVIKTKWSRISNNSSWVLYFTTAIYTVLMRPLSFFNLLKPSGNFTYNQV